MKRNFREIRILKLNYYYFFYFPLNRKSCSMGTETKNSWNGQVPSWRQLHCIAQNGPTRGFFGFCSAYMLAFFRWVYSYGCFMCYTCLGWTRYVLKDVIGIFWLGRVCKYFSGSGTRPITWAPYKFGQSSHTDELLYYYWIW